MNFHTPQETFMKSIQNLLLGAALAMSGWASPLVSHAQAFPNKPVRLVVPTSAGTPVDILTRVVAASMAADLAQPVVVENKPGAGGIMGAQEVLRQPADGYNLLTLYMGMTITQSIFRNVSFDLRRDFAPVGQSLFSYNVLVVNPKVPANNVKELAALAKSRSGQFNYASGGIGSPAHLVSELFAQSIQAKLTHVPYPAFPQALGDLVGGQVEMMFVATAPAIGFIESGRLKPLAVTGQRRLAALKDVPTMAEAGFPDVAIRDWQGILVKAGTPADVVERLNIALRKALNTDEVRQAFARVGAEPTPSAPAEFGALITQDVDRLGQLARTAQIRAD
jgi:tripartite-type tricarboxylate transporter receptor subunit TctC